MQGGWETDETAEEAAVREAMEEAGVRGSVEVPLAYPLSINLLWCIIAWGRG